jgi:uncharacterized protein YutE (UPF0331/DUF86 family)
MLTEYLITFNSKDAQCVDVDQLKNLLRSHSDIKFEKPDVINYKSKLFKILIGTGKLPDESVYYDLTLECCDNGDIETFNEFLRALRAICIRNSGREVVVLNDGIGEFYCQLSYPVIYKIENSMRKLISKFMAIGLGINWTSSSVPKEVSASINGEGRKNAINLLFEVDFIQLANILFKKYSNNDGNKFFESVKGMDGAAQISANDLKQYVPYSNWERYFANKVKCDAQYLDAKWTKIYEYRCKIAHCRSLNKVEYDDLLSMCDEVKEKIEQALSSVNDLHIIQGDRDAIAENITAETNLQVAKFLAYYNKLTLALSSACDLCSGPNDSYNLHEANKTNVRMQANYLANTKNIISRETAFAITSIQAFRNRIVHDFGNTIMMENEINENIERLSIVLKELLKMKVADLSLSKDINLSRDDSIETTKE